MILFYLCAIKFFISRYCFMVLFNTALCAQRDFHRGSCPPCVGNPTPVMTYACLILQKLIYNLYLSDFIALLIVGCFCNPTEPT